MKKLRLGTTPFGSVVVLLALAVSLLSGVLTTQQSILSRTDLRYVRKNLNPQVATANVDAIVTPTGTGKTPIEIQSTGASQTGALFRVLANNSSARFTLDAYGTAIFGAGVKFTFNGSTAGGTSGAPVAINGLSRCFVGVNTGLTANNYFNLPAANLYAGGQMIVVFDQTGAADGTHTITVNRAGSDTINAGATSKTIAVAYGMLIFICDGSAKWFCYAPTVAFLLPGQRTDFKHIYQIHVDALPRAA